MAWLEDELKNLIQNLRAGARMALFRRDAVSKTRISADQVFFLAVLDILMMLALDWVKAQPRPEFNSWGFASAGFGFALICAVAYAFARLQSNKALILRLVVCVYSIGPWFSLLGFVLHRGYPALAEQSPWGAYLLWWSLAAWYYAVIGWILVRLAGARVRRWRVAATLAGFLVVSMMSMSLHVDLFYARTDPDTESQRTSVNAEEVFDAQPELLQRAARTLRPGQPGVPAMYFLGFASYASQDVFKKETLYARNLLDNRFGTRGRSLVMINNADTTNQFPLASGANLRRALKMIARKMDLQQDVLFVYLTSHGSEKDGLAANFWPLSLNDISAEKFKAYLDEAGIRWRVLLVSSCYSGHFVDVLKDDYSLVMTASAANRQSFGCSNTRDFTYFGEAVFKDALNRERAFVPAFQSAITAIKQREANEKLEPSMPQLFIGARIGAKLATLERHLGPVPAHSVASGAGAIHTVAGQ